MADVGAYCRLADAVVEYGIVAQQCVNCIRTLYQHCETWHIFASYGRLQVATAWLTTIESEIAPRTVDAARGRTSGDCIARSPHILSAARPLNVQAVPTRSLVTLLLLLPWGEAFEKHHCTRSDLSCMSTPGSVDLPRFRVRGSGSGRRRRRPGPLTPHSTLHCPPSPPLPRKPLHT